MDQCCRCWQRSTDGPQKKLSTMIRPCQLFLRSMGGPGPCIKDLVMLVNNLIDGNIMVETSGKEVKNEAHIQQRRKTKIGSKITSCCFTLEGGMLLLKDLFNKVSFYYIADSVWWWLISWVLLWNEETIHQRTSSNGKGMVRLQFNELLDDGFM